MMVVGAWQYSTFLSATVNTATSVQSTPGNKTRYNLTQLVMITLFNY